VSGRAGILSSRWLPLFPLLAAVALATWGWLGVGLEIAAARAVLSTSYVDLDLRTAEGRREATRISRDIERQTRRLGRKALVLEIAAVVLAGGSVVWFVLRQREGLARTDAA
jgi:hypothetical protein